MKNKIGKVALLGLGNRSTLFYVDQLNEQYNKLNKGYSTFPMWVLNTDFNKINPHLPNKFENLIPIANSYFKELEDLGASRLIIPNITFHETIDQIETSIEVLHPLNILKENLSKCPKKKVSIIGSYYTMSCDYLDDCLLPSGIEKVEIADDDKIWIDKFRIKVYEGEESDLEIEKFKELCLNYQAEAEIVIACTELSIHAPKELKYDLAQLQIKALINS